MTNDLYRGCEVVKSESGYHWIDENKTPHFLSSIIGREFYKTSDDCMNAIDQWKRSQRA